MQQLRDCNQKDYNAILESTHLTISRKVDENRKKMDDKLDQLKKSLNKSMKEAFDKIKTHIQKTVTEQIQNTVTNAVKKEISLINANIENVKKSVAKTGDTIQTSANKQLFTFRTEVQNTIVEFEFTVNQKVDQIQESIHQLEESNLNIVQSWKMIKSKIDNE